jgi:hypothetical protein
MPWFDIEDGPELEAPTSADALFLLRQRSLREVHLWSNFRLMRPEKVSCARSFSRLGSALLGMIWAATILQPPWRQPACLPARAENPKLNRSFTFVAAASIIASVFGGD